MTKNRGILFTATGSSSAYACRPAEHSAFRQHPVLLNDTYCVAFGGDPCNVFPSEVLPASLSVFCGHGETVFVYDPDGEDVNMEAFASPATTAPIEEAASKEEEHPPDEQEDDEDDDDLFDLLSTSEEDDERDDVVNDGEEEESEEEDSDDED